MKLKEPLTMKEVHSFLARIVEIKVQFQTETLDDDILDGLIQELYDMDAALKQSTKLRRIKRSGLTLIKGGLQ